MNTKILVIDDEAAVRDMLSSYLQCHGFIVMAASTGAEALRQCRIEKFDLITLDLVLPDVDGLDLLASIRNFDRDTPIIIATGNDPNQALINAAKMRGASGFASKTGPLKELLAQIQTLAGLK